MAIRSHSRDGPIDVERCGLASIGWREQLDAHIGALPDLAYEGSHMGDRLRNKIAVISGGATGMGGAASKLFAAEGARVAIIIVDN